MIKRTTFLYDDHLSFEQNFEEVKYFFKKLANIFVKCKTVLLMTYTHIRQNLPEGAFRKNQPVTLKGCDKLRLMIID